MKRAGATNSALIEGRSSAPNSTNTMSPAASDRLSWRLCTGRPFPRIPSTPSGQANISGPLSSDSGAWTTPGTAVPLRNSAMLTAGPRCPLRKALFPSFGSTSPQNASNLGAVGTDPVSSPQQRAGNAVRKWQRSKSSASRATAGWSPSPRGQSGCANSAAMGEPAASAVEITLWNRTPKSGLVSVILGSFRF